MIFTIFRGMQISIALGDVNPDASMEAGVFCSGPAFVQRLVGTRLLIVLIAASRGMKIFQFPRLSKLEALCVLWPHFKSLVDC